MPAIKDKMRRDQLPARQGDFDVEGAEPESGVEEERPKNTRERLPFQEDATPEEQEQYDKTVLAGLKVLFDSGAISDEIEDMLKQGAETPEETLANVTTMVMTQLDEQADIPEAVIMPASEEIIENLGELANSTGAFEVDQQVLTRAGQHLMINLAEQYGVDEESLAEMLNSVDQETRKKIIAEQRAAAGDDTPVEDAGGVVNAARGQGQQARPQRPPIQEGQV